MVGTLKSKNMAMFYCWRDSDEKSKNEKGLDRPIVPESERLENADLPPSVNHVVLKIHSTPNGNW